MPENSWFYSRGQVFRGFSSTLPAKAETFTPHRNTVYIRIT